MHTRKQDLAEIKMLTDRRSFLDIQSNGQKWVSHGLVVQIKENNLGLRRIGFTVSKKIDKSAVKRNRIKRRLRAVASDVLSAYARDGCDYILVGKKSSAARPYDSMVNDLKWCLKKTGYYHKTERDNEKG
tara:strand:+ start:696 stop:1085 length:390 start_codon:yes stop_codon:yes gene_type:complete